TLFVLLSTTVIAQAPPVRDRVPAADGTASVRGRVVAADTGEPLRKARVSLGASTPVTVNAVTTDNEGRFVFTALPAAQYTDTARNPGYAPTRYGARRPTSAPIPIEVSEGAAVDGIELRMPRGAAISGRILDEFGDPIDRVVVNAERLVPSG